MPTVETRPTIRKPRRLQPVAGTFRWLARPGELAEAGCLAITATRQDGQQVTALYLVTENRDGLALLGFRLQKADGSHYDLPAELTTCDCADATHNPERPGGCKHRRALGRALASLQPTPDRPRAA
jgi:hypothetical protein